MANGLKEKYMNNSKQKDPEYDFHNWTVRELFDFLIDLHQLPYEEEFDNWKCYRNDLLRWCNETCQKV